MHSGCQRALEIRKYYLTVFLVSFKVIGKPCLLCGVMPNSLLHLVAKILHYNVVDTFSEKFLATVCRKPTYLLKSCPVNSNHSIL